MKNQILVILFSIMLLNNALAIKISLSPAHISLSGKTNTELCKKIIISSDKKIIFYGEDKWSLKNEGSNFAKYNLSSQKLNIKVLYPKQIIPDTENISFCIISENPGKFYGILYYKTSEGTGSIGSLIKADITEENKNNKIFVTLIFSSLTLMLTLFLLLIWNKRV